MENENIILLDKKNEKTETETETKKIDVPRSTIDMLEQTFQLV